MCSLCGARIKSPLYVVFTGVCVSLLCGVTTKSPLYVVFAGVWITTAGTVYDDLARRIGEALHNIMLQSGDAYKKPVLIGFTKLRNVINRDEIRNKSAEIATPVTEVHRR